MFAGGGGGGRGCGRVVIVKGSNQGFTCLSPQPHHHVSKVTFENHPLYQHEPNLSYKTVSQTPDFNNSPSLFFNYPCLCSKQSTNYPPKYAKALLSQTQKPRDRTADSEQRAWLVHKIPAKKQWHVCVLLKCPQAFQFWSHSFLQNSNKITGVPV